MSTFRAQAIAGRVVVVHDMPSMAVVSELDVEQADVLLRQLEVAVRRVVGQFPTRPPGSASGSASH